MTLEWIGNCIKCGGKLYYDSETGEICNCDCTCPDRHPCSIHQPYQYEQWLLMQKEADMDAQ